MKFVKRTIRDGHIAVITLGDGRSIEADFNDLAYEMQLASGTHGLKQKLGDGTSSFSKAKDYDGAYTEVVAIRDSIVIDGVWNRKGSSAGARDIVEATHRVSLAEGKAKHGDDYELTIEDVEVSINNMDIVTYNSLCDDERIKAAIKQLQAERAQEKANASTSTLDLDSFFS